MYRKVELNSISTEIVPHTHSFSHDMIVTKGKVIVKLEDKEFTLSSGDIKTIPAQDSHSVRMCPCVTEATFLCVWAGGQGSYEETTRGT